MFSLSIEQQTKLNEWRKSLKPISIADLGAIGGEYTYSFTPTSLGVITKVKRFDNNEIDLTNYDEW